MTTTLRDERAASMTSSSSDVVTGAVPRSPVRTLQELLNEIERVKADVQTRVSISKSGVTNGPTAANHGKDLRDRLMQLQRQMETIRNDSNPPWPATEFDQSKQRGLETISGLFQQLDGTDQQRQPTNGNASESTSTDEDSDPPAKATTAERSRHEVSESESDDDDGVMNHRPATNGSAHVRKKQELSDSSGSEDPSSTDEDDNQTMYVSRDGVRVDPNGKKRPNLNEQWRTSTPIQNKPGQDLTRRGKNAEGSTIDDGHSLSSNASLHRRARTTGKKRTEVDDDLSSASDKEDAPRETHVGSRAAPNDQEESEHSDGAEELGNCVYEPGTRFRAIQSFQAIQPNDLPFKVNDILILREQRADQWWLCEHEETGQQGVVPINHIKLYSTARAVFRTSTAASIKADAWRTTGSVPSGFIASDLASLSQLPENQLYRTLLPRMTESNLAFADLHWDYETKDIRPLPAEHQIILTIKACVKIPRVDANQLQVLNRCLRVCLYDGHQIISNIHSSRAFPSKQPKAQDRTEDWSFEDSGDQAFIDEQCQFLIRSNHQESLYLLMELSQYCQSKTTTDLCDIGCGWLKVQLDDVPLSLIGDTKSYNEFLNGGHVHETNIPLNSEYHNLETRGLSGKIDRYKRARVKFSLTFRDSEINLLYDQLPLTSMIVPINLIVLLVLFRNELARQLSERTSSNGISTMPIDSIFLSTFEQFLAQPNLVHIFCSRYRSKKPFSFRRKRTKCLEIYTTFIYPRLCFLPWANYNFHTLDQPVERRRKLRELVQSQLIRAGNRDQTSAMAALLLDPTFTDQWKPFTIDETSFSLQKRH